MRVRQLAGAALLIGAFPLAHAMTPFLLRDSIPVCPFRIATGKPCPLCGMTRAIALATHGRWRAAFGVNALWPLFAVTMLFLSLLLLIDAFARRSLTAHFVQMIVKRWGWIVAALCAFDAWRITTGR
jgi:hypothetical protein